MQIQTTGKTVADIYDEVDHALDSAFMFRLIDGNDDDDTIHISKIQGPLKVLKVRRKNWHDMFEEMSKLPGSRGALGLLKILAAESTATALQSLQRKARQLLL